MRMTEKKNLLVQMEVMVPTQVPWCELLSSRSLCLENLGGGGGVRLDVFVHGHRHIIVYFKYYFHNNKIGPSSSLIVHVR